MLKEFFDKLEVVSTSPYAFVAYILLIAAWVYVIVSRARLKRVANSLEKLPLDERAGLLAREYSTFPKSGLDAEQWLKSKRQQLLFWAFLAVILAVIILGTIALVSKGESLKENTEVTDWQMFMYLNVIQLSQGGNQEVRECTDSLGNLLDFPPIKIEQGEPVNVTLSVRLIIDNVFRKHQDLIYPIGLSTTWTPGKVHTIYDGQDAQISREYNGPKFQRTFFSQFTVDSPSSRGRHYVLIMSGAVLNANQLFYSNVSMKDTQFSIWRKEFREFESNECFGYLEHVLVHPGNKLEKVTYPILAIPIEVEASSGA